MHLLVHGIDGAHLTLAMQREVQLLRHLRRRGQYQSGGILALSECIGEHGFGVIVPVITRHQHERDVAIQFAQFADHAVSGQSAADDDDRVHDITPFLNLDHLEV